MHLKIPSAKWRSFCLGRDELNIWNINSLLGLYTSLKDKHSFWIIKISNNPFNLVSIKAINNITKLHPSTQNTLTKNVWHYIPHDFNYAWQWNIAMGRGKCILNHKTSYLGTQWHVVTGWTLTLAVTDNHMARGGGGWMCSTTPKHHSHPTNPTPTHPDQHAWMHHGIYENTQLYPPGVIKKCL